MKQLVAESLNEYLGVEEEQEVLDEGILDFIKSMRQLVAKALKTPEDEKAVNNALGAAFAKQFGKNPKLKETILKWDAKKKQELLKMAAEKLQDKTIGILKIGKDDNGKIVVSGFKVKGGEVAGNAAGQTQQ
jgi:hypothetical protein